MEIIPYIDIVGDTRIQSLLDDAENYVFSAFAAEFLDGWVPDIGLTNYAHAPSIYRPASVVSAEVTSTLRHRRFRVKGGTSETAFTGEAFIGVVVYATADEPYVLEFQLRDEALGRIELTRHDNRRHLIVLDRPITFIGQMEILRIQAPGGGTCRIETIVFLRQRPEPSSFAPEIQRLSTRIVERSMQRVTAEVHFVTSETATCTARIRSGTADAASTGVVETATPARVHAITLPDLQPEHDYAIDIMTSTSSGASATATTHLRTATLPDLANRPVVVPIEICNTTHTATQGMPLTFGVPLPVGHVADTAACYLRAGANVIAAQTRVLSRWPDRSARWVLVDAPCIVQIAGNAAVPAEVLFHPTDDASMPEIMQSPMEAEQVHISIADAGNGPRIQITRPNAGSEQNQLIEGVAAPIVTLASGAVLTQRLSEPACVEEAGHERTTIRYVIEHTDPDGVPHMRSVVRVHSYHRHALIKLAHRLEVISPALDSATGEPTGVPLDAIHQAIAENIPTAGAEASSMLRVRSVAWPLERPGNRKVAWNDQHADLGAAGTWELRHLHDCAYQITTRGQTQHIDERMHGYAVVHGDAGPLLVGMRQFWETAPHALRVIPDRVIFGVLPQIDDEALPGDEHAWQRLYFWHQAGCYTLKNGMALSSDYLLGWNATPDDAVARATAWFEQPPLVRPAIDWLNATNAFIPIEPKTSTALPRYEHMIDAAYAAWLADREQHRQYGFLNFGDWYGETTWSWGNNEYDSPFSHMLEFLRGGNPGWGVLAAQAARHMADVDTCNFSTNPDHIGGQYMHMPGHVGGYLPPFFRSKMAGSTFDQAHIWGEGLVLYYLSSGDEAVRETIERSARFRMNPSILNTYDFRNARAVGWHITQLCALARWSDDPRYLNAASLLVERVLERQAPGGGWVHQLTASHCGCPPPRCQGEAGFMVGVLLSALRRYYELTNDARVAAAIVGGARWLIAHLYDPVQGQFRYTSCPSYTEASAASTQQVIEGIVYAYSLTGDDSLRAIIDRALEQIGLPRTDIMHNGYGKALCQETRYVPTLLAALRAGDTQQQQMRLA